LAIAALTVSGPFGTFADFDIWHRLIYWSAVAIPSMVLGRGAMIVTLQWLRPTATNNWLRILIGGLAAAMPVLAIVAGINTLVHYPAAIDPLRLTLNVTAATLVIVAAIALTRSALPVPMTNDSAQLVPPRILQRIPPSQRGQLLALSVADHYVDVITDRGTTLVLMRLGDAMKEAGSIKGLQIHRSHWVAHNAVVKTHRSDGRLSLELKNGLRLPVSRGFLRQVRAAGLT
jgi:DNA-binding LytR/AlgR family response regulator